MSRSTFSRAPESPASPGKKRLPSLGERSGRARAGETWIPGARTVHAAWRVRRSQQEAKIIGPVVRGGKEDIETDRQTGREGMGPSGRQAAYDVSIEGKKPPSWVPSTHHRRLSGGSLLGIMLGFGVTTKLMKLDSQDPSWHRPLPSPQQWVHMAACAVD